MKIYVQKLKVNTDGASIGNPGPAGIGIVLRDFHGRELRRISRFVGVKTNNEAEYTAIIEALKLSVELGADEVIICTDSELVVKQLTGLYRVKSKKLKPLYERVKLLMEKFKKVDIMHIPREENRLADALAKKAARRK